MNVNELYGKIGVPPAGSFEDWVARYAELRSQAKAQPDDAFDLAHGCITVREYRVVAERRV